MKTQKNKPQGFVAIVSLLIVATVSMMFAMGMLLDGVDNASLSTGSINYENARINATTCAEDALVRMRQELQFTRNLNYTISENNACTSSITWYAENPVSLGLVERLVDLNVTGVSNGFSRSFLYQMKMKRFDVNNTDGSLDYLNTVEFISIDEQTS